MQYHYYMQYEIRNTMRNERTAASGVLFAAAYSGAGRYRCMDEWMME
jgi:hypothetical protein